MSVEMSTTELETIRGDVSYLGQWGPLEPPGPGTLCYQVCLKYKWINKIFKINDLQYLFPLKFNIYLFHCCGSSLNRNRVNPGRWMMPPPTDSPQPHPALAPFIYWVIGRGIFLRERSSILCTGQNQYPIMCVSEGNGWEERERNSLVYYGVSRICGACLLCFLGVGLQRDGWTWEVSEQRK